MFPCVTEKYFPCVTAKFPVFSLSGKSKNQIPCFPCCRGHTAHVHEQVRVTMTFKNDVLEHRLSKRLDLLTSQ